MENTKIVWKRKPSEEPLAIREKNGVTWLSFPALEEMEMVSHGFSTRLGGVSEGKFATMNFTFTRGDNPDHVHMLVSIPPKISVSSFMGYLKGKSALMMFDRHANLKYKFGNRHFWSEGYYVSTVGLNEATIKKYIQDQEKADIMQDKLSVKEYEDPFKG